MSGRSGTARPTGADYPTVDDGCSIHDHCMECPLPSCIHDIPIAEARVWVMRAHKFRLVEQARDAKHLMELTGMAAKTAARAIRRYKKVGGDYLAFLGATPDTPPSSPQPKLAKNPMFRHVPGPGEFALENGGVVDAKNARRLLLNRLWRLGYSKECRDMAIDQVMAQESEIGARLPDLFRSAREICAANEQVG